MSGQVNAWHLSAQEIADLRLAGLPTTKRGVVKRATAEDWPWIERSGRGGGRLYNIAALPDAARADFFARQVDIAEHGVNRGGRPKGSDFFTRNPEIAEAVTVILADQKRSARTVRKMLAIQLGGTVELPGLRTFQNYLKQVEQDQKLLLTATRDPDRFKSRYRPALGRMDATVTYAHEVWEIDTTKADVLCTDGRKSILGIIDRWSRRSRFLVVESESAQSVRRILVDTISAWGVMPARLKVDNGSGFINGSVIAALDTLGIELDPCLPGHPEDKPFVERLFGTFNRERASLLDGFAGHNVAQAQQLRAAAKKRTGRAVVVPQITGAQLQDIIDAWVDAEYHLRAHSGIRMSPMQKWQQSPVRARAAPSADVLKVALSAFIGTATVGKRGIRWKSGRYWSASLVPYMDRQVTLRMDEDDLGALFVFDADGRFIDTAVNWERSGLSEQQFALAARRHMSTFMAEQKAELAARRKKFSVDDAKQALLRDEAERAGKLVHLPMPTRPDQTAAMASIANAPTPQRIEQAQLDHVMRDTAPATRTELKPAEKMAQADAIMAAARAGNAVDPDALRRAQLYSQSSEYRAEKIVSDYFNTPPARPRQPDIHTSEPSRTHGVA